MSDKLLAEWFWTDRWIGSSAFGLPLEARGLYREMLTQAWRRGARLPNDHDQVRRMTGVTLKEWRRSWGLVERFWRVDGDSLVNDTQLEIYADAKERAAKASDRGSKGGFARAQALLKHNTSTPQAELERKPPITDHRSPNIKQFSTDTRGGSPRPIFKGQRFTVFEWQLEALMRLLGPNLERFDLHAWFSSLDGQVVESLEMVPQRDGGAWLLAKTQAEALRRGLSMAASADSEEAEYAALIKKGPSVRP